MRFIRMPQPLIGTDSILILPADFFPFDDAGRFQIGDDPLYGPLGDSDPLSDVTESRGRVAVDAEKDLGVVREEPPRLLGVFQA